MYLLLLESQCHTKAVILEDKTTRPYTLNEIYAYYLDKEFVLEDEIS
jgi:hypothetical protein